MWPNLFLVGAMKAGTTTVAGLLDSHRDVFVPPIKEPNFFCSDLYTHGLGLGKESTSSVLRRVRRGEKLHHAYIADGPSYLSLFENHGKKSVVADCSTTYLYSESAAGNISNVVPDARILVILRNPIDRAYSEFLMNCRIGTARPPFSSMLDLECQELRHRPVPIEHRYVTAGLYSKQVERYLQAFGHDQVLVLRFEDIHLHLENLMNRIWDFVGVRTNASPKKRGQEPGDLSART